MSTVAIEGAVIALADRTHPAPPAPDGFDLAAAWHEHGRVLLGYAANALGDRQAAEDCVQETFVRAWAARDRFSERRGSVRTWLFAIARNVVVDAARARARRATPVTDEGVARLLPPQPGAEDQVEARVVLVEALAGLSPEHREVLVAVKLDGLTYAELAERNGVPVATLRTRAYHALRAMRATLGEEETDAHHA
ncbi:sigma-70 family RNA polymerase sigma factor [Nocardioides aequoreus]|uniref:sigma-70 family RNA polymerase sigma factor n=1 Tax=Nocardioides aequoreus TaxID=397278 RepID=UPI0004C3D0C8|nr:sigma-70 family RNA polymerase sigma factor [Nocardioides aequoreus]